MQTSESLDDIITETNVVSETLQSVDVENNNPINVVFTVSEENDNVSIHISATKLNIYKVKCKYYRR